jgi:DNA replication ATP-dependent helicase Dna2
MVAEIMAFPNEHFYDGFLQTLEENNPDDNTNPPVEKGNIPVLFLATPAEETFPGQKTNRTEAELAARLTAFFQRQYAARNLPWRPDKTLGIITPWRAQIAQIRECLAAAGLHPDSVTVDTVERYQGGARDVILISCCVNSPAQLSSLVSLSAEGVDRKLNVALTRARRQLVVMGNPDILNRDERYREFIARYKGEAPA